MALRDLDELLGPSTLDLPVGGHTYSVPEADAETGLLCQRLMAGGMKAAGGDVEGAQRSFGLLDDDDEQGLYERVLGAAYHEMVEAGVSFTQLKHCALTAVMWTVFGREYAETFWEQAGAEGEAPAPNRAARRQASKATATSTRSRGSTAGTTSRPKPAAAARAPRGGRSSSTGS